MPSKTWLFVFLFTHWFTTSIVLFAYLKWVRVEIKGRKINMPFDRVHDITHSFGYLLFKWRGNWFMLCVPWKRKEMPKFGILEMNRGYEIRKCDKFHNCTLTRVG